MYKRQGHAACTLAKDIKAGALMAITKTGYTAIRMSKFRPNINIIGATPYYKTYHQLSLIWGVTPIIAKYKKDLEHLFNHCIKIAENEGLLKKDDKVVMSCLLYTSRCV